MSTGKKKYIAKTQANKKKEITKADAVNKPMVRDMKTSVKYAAKKAPINAPKPPGYTESKGGIMVPDGCGSPSYVATGKLQAGIENAKDQIKGTLKNIASVFTQDFEVSEIEISVTFTADGKFLGFGTGGAMSAKVKIRPSND